MTSTKVRSFLPVHTKFSTTEFRSAGQIHLEVAIGTSNVILSIAPVYSSLMEAASTYPAPSYCSHHAVWSERQEDGAANRSMSPSNGQTPSSMTSSASFSSRPGIRYQARSTAFKSHRLHFSLASEWEACSARKRVLVAL